MSRPNQINMSNMLNDRRNNSREFREEEPNLLAQNIPKGINLNDSKQEFDIKECDIEEIEKLTNSKILCNIGYGGFSTVKLIYNNQQKSYFAMKVVNLKNKKFKKKTPSKNREFIYQEILVNFNTRNHNIIKLYGYFNHKEYVLLILEYMNNRDLKYFMKRFHSKYPDTNFSETLTAFFINQILKALAYLKMRNILHRDIKPENIMLNGNYVSKLGDFSLSRKVDMNNNFKTSRSGTLPYLSPECVKKKIEIKPYQCERMDLFSLGVVMYFLLFNRHPYDYKNQMNVKDYGKKLDEATLNFEGNNITNTCKSFLSGLLEKNINRRFSFEQAVNHPWVILLKDKVEDITSNYSSDPDKMILELNKCIVNDEFFEKNNTYKNLDNSCIYDHSELEKEEDFKKFKICKLIDINKENEKIKNNIKKSKKPKDKKFNNIKDLLNSLVNEGDYTRDEANEYLNDFFGTKEKPKDYFTSDLSDLEYGLNENENYLNFEKTLEDYFSMKKFNKDKDLLEYEDNIEKIEEEAEDYLNTPDKNNINDNNSPFIEKENSNRNENLSKRIENILENNTLLARKRLRNLNKEN